jgi:hypothetical protein
MHPSELIILSRIRRQEIDEEFRRIRLYRRMNANQPKMISRALKNVCGLLAAARQVVKKEYAYTFGRRQNLL